MKINIPESPKFYRALNGWATVFFTILIPISYVVGWFDSVPFVVSLSLWALVSGHLAGWQAARVEVKQHEDNDVAEVMQKLEELRKIIEEKNEEK